MKHSLITLTAAIALCAAACSPYRNIDLQAHRGGAGLMPENTISAMRNAIDLGVNTLEFDLHVSSDGQVVVSHDPYFHPRYSTRPDGSLVQDRLTITVRVRFTNKFDENQNFEQTFSRYADYSSSRNLSSVESNLVTEINDALTDDIFNKAFVNW